MVREAEVPDLLCPICILEFDTLEEFNEHRFSATHKERWLNRQYRMNRKKFVGDSAKNGFSIEVTSAQDQLILHNASLFTIEILTGLDVYIFTITLVHNGKEDSNFYLRDFDALNKTYLMETKTTISFSDHFQVQKGETFPLFKKGSRYDIKVTIYPGGRVRTIRIPIVFHLLSSSNETSFYIGRDLEIKGEEHDVRDFGNFVPGVYPKITNDELPKNLPLQKYDVPSWFQMAAFNNEIHGHNPRLLSANHNRFFKYLLWLEELQLEMDIQYYSKENVTMKKVPHRVYSAGSAGVTCLELIENGLAENRPCVMERDAVFVCRSIEIPPSGIAIQWYQGIVHKVTNSSLYLAFEQRDFMDKFHEDIEFNVEFIIGRYPLRVCHRAIDLCKSLHLQNFLFPPMPSGHCPLLPDIKPYNKNLSTNLEQLQAVKHIVARSSWPAPYLVFGPPGTGKTMAIVEAIKQVLYLNSKSHVLACAPSNSAADVIAERLLDNFDEKHVLRLYAKSRSRILGVAASEKLLKASNFREDQVYFPPLATIMSKRVVVCTFCTAARIASACFPEGHFNHVILDEVGHSMEPEALVAIAGILSNSGQLVLAGDPHQLGPVVRSLQATGGSHLFPQRGLNTSYLERLMSLEMYQKNGDGKFNPRLVTKLLNNYRSHKDILKVPNDLFYNSELRVEGDSSRISSLCNLPFLPTKGFPLIFHATDGQDVMEPRSPSFCNPQEVNVIVKYVRDILNNRTPKVSAKDIGVISPYRLQVEKLRRKFSDLPLLKVGSVEDFQGEERKVIVISTVRASQTHLAKDEIYKLGFLRNPKRFNVAVTRAQALIVIVGCPRVLQLDTNWLRLIDHIKEGGGYVGAAVPPPLDNIDNIIYQMQKLDISPTFRQISEKQVVEAPSFGEY